MTFLIFARMYCYVITFIIARDSLCRDLVRDLSKKEPAGRSAESVVRSILQSLDEGLDVSIAVIFRVASCVWARSSS